MLGSLICRLGSHVIDRKRVWHDGYDYRTTCRRCSEELLRDNDGWRVFVPGRDDNGFRKPHPRHSG